MLNMLTIPCIDYRSNFITVFNVEYSRAITLNDVLSYTRVHNFDILDSNVLTIV